MNFSHGEYFIHIKLEVVLTLQVGCMFSRVAEDKMRVVLM